MILGEVKFCSKYPSSPQPRLLCDVGWSEVRGNIITTALLTVYVCHLFL